MIAAATGVLLSLGTKWGLVRYWWVVVKIAISIIVVLTDAFVLGNAAHDHLANATTPGLDGAEYSVMKKPPPDIARPSAPRKPVAPAADAPQIDRASSAR